MLDMSGSWVNLRELSLGLGNHHTGMIHEQSPTAGCALIKSENQTFHHSPQLMSWLVVPNFA